MNYVVVRISMQLSTDLSFNIVIQIINYHHFPIPSSLRFTFIIGSRKQSKIPVIFLDKEGLSMGGTSITARTYYGNLDYSYTFYNETLQ